jgi:hypothetical protein
MKRSNETGEPREMVSSISHAKVSSKSLKGIRIVNFCIALLLFLGNVVIQSWGLGRQELPDPPDEGVYLYQAKLITQGYLPYRDFAMTSHVPFLMYLNALVLKLCNFDMLAYHRTYVAWVFLTIFPLFATVLYFTRSRVASVLSVVLFSTFAEFVQMDAHFFEIREASLPFFACFIYFFFVERKETLSYIFLSLFSFCLITNFFISLVFVITVFLYGCMKHRRSIGEWIKKYIRTCWVFVLLTGTYFCFVALIPGSLSNLLAVQKDIYPYLQRLIDVKDMMSLNWPIFLFGTLGILFSIKKIPLLSLLSILTLLIAAFISGSFYTHYLSIIAVPFAIMGGISISKILRILNSNEIKIAFIGMFLIALYQTVYSNLAWNLITETTPDFFKTVRVLEHSPEPLFTLQPIYALYAHKNLVMYYNTAEMRVFRATNTNLSDEMYHAILNRSNTVLLEPFANSKLPQEVKEEIFQNYTLTYTNGIENVYVRK